MKVDEDDSILQTGKDESRIKQEFVLLLQFYLFLFFIFVSLFTNLFFYLIIFFFFFIYFSLKSYFCSVVILTGKRDGSKDKLGNNNKYDNI